MKKWVKTNIVLLVLIAIGIASASGILIHRTAIEQENKVYDLVVDYADFRDMADQSSENLDFWLNHLRENGVDKVALFETTAEALAKEPGSSVQVILTKQILKEPDWRDSYPESVIKLIEASENTVDALISCKDMDEFEWIIDAYEDRAEGMQYKIVREDGVGYLWIYGNKNGISGETWSKFSLGLWPEQVETIENAGLSVIPRTRTEDKINGEKFAKDVYSDFKKYNSPYFMNSGDGIVGFDDPAKGAEMLNEYLEETGGAFIVTEEMNEQGNVQWPGSAAYVESTDFNAVRAFNMWDYIQCRYQYYGYDGPQEITNSLYRAIYERSCRVINFRAILAEKPKSGSDDYNYVTDPEEYTALIEGLHDRMAKYGYVHATAEAADSYMPSFLMRFLVGVGAVSAAVLLLGMIFTLSARVRYILLGFAVVCVAGAMFVMPNTAKLLLSMGAGAVMPCVAAVGINRYIQYTSAKNGNISSVKLLAETLAGAVVLMLVCFIGSLFTASALSESAYMLEMNLYRGVKIMQLIPVAVYVFSFIQIFFFEEYIFRGVSPASCGSAEELSLARRNAWNDFLDTPVKLRGVFYAAIACVVLGFIGILGIYYIMRTGNTDASTVSTLELQFRNMLEETLVARPRTKEFLIGYPCMMLMIWSFRRKLPAVSIIFGGGSVIGFTSIVNTFLHIRTPFMVSFARVFTGLAFGLVIGLAAVLVFEAAYKIIMKYKRA